MALLLQIEGLGPVQTVAAADIPAVGVPEIVPQ